MTKESLDQLWEARRRQVEFIIATPEQYKECATCRAIWKKRVERCRCCGAYRFCETKETVETTANEMLEHPFPSTAAFAPRLGLEIRSIPFITNPEPR